MNGWWGCEDGYVVFFFEKCDCAWEVEKWDSSEGECFVKYLVLLLLFVYVFFVMMRYSKYVCLMSIII